MIRSQIVKLHQDCIIYARYAGTTQLIRWGLPSLTSMPDLYVTKSTSSKSILQRWGLKSVPLQRPGSRVMIHSHQWSFHHLDMRSSTNPELRIEVCLEDLIVLEYPLNMEFKTLEMAVYKIKHDSITCNLVLVYRLPSASIIK